MSPPADIDGLVGTCLVVAAVLLAVTRQLMLKQWVGNA